MFDVRTTIGIDEGTLKLKNVKSNVSFIEFIGRTKVNNGIKGYINIFDKLKVNEENVISISQVGTIIAQMRKNRWYASQNMFKLMPIDNRLVSLFVLGSINRVLNATYSAGYSNYPTIEKLKQLIVELPIKFDGTIDFDFMNSFISELEAYHISELEAYLLVTGLKDYKLTKEEEKALKIFNNSSDLKWGEFNIKSLFGKSSRGKRLKSDDRLVGKLPFVTAGEVDEGVSAYICNEVDVYNENTITVDMFGSAKYRNYKYGCDDHVAVVHTERIDKFATLFITSAVHKSSHNGQFNYGNNFYASDADELNIMLPIDEYGEIDFSFMKNLISGIQKMVIKDVVLYSENKIKVAKKVIEN